MSSAIGSYLTGQLSVLTGQGSAPTATGVCAPFPHKFLKDGASLSTGGFAVKTATTPEACESERDCEAEDIQWGPVTFNETDVATNPPSALIQVVKVIPLDGSVICDQTMPGGKLQFGLLAGEINYSEVGGVTFMIGLNATNPLEGVAVWNSSTNPTGGLWLDQFGRVDFQQSFNNPNPTGTFYLKLVATPGAGALAGLRNWTAHIFNN